MLFVDGKYLLCADGKVEYLPGFRILNHVEKLKNSHSLVLLDSNSETNFKINVLSDEDQVIVNVNKVNLSCHTKINQRLYCI